MGQPKKFGIFGGLFDPPHIGHLIISQYVKEEFDLDKIVFLPAGKPPHKTGYSPYRHRYFMTRLAIRGNHDFLVSPVEGEMLGMTYTVDVLKNLRRSFTHTLYLIIGADQWREILTWKNPTGLSRLCKFIVVPRPGYPVRPILTRFSRIHVSRSPRLDISSTLIRDLVIQGGSIKYLTPEPVIKYIRKHNLKRLWIKR